MVGTLRMLNWDINRFMVQILKIKIYINHAFDMKRTHLRGQRSAARLCRLSVPFSSNIVLLLVIALQENLEFQIIEIGLSGPFCHFDQGFHDPYITSL